jgi:hypothetical protein
VIAFIAGSRVSRPRSAPAHPPLSLPRIITTLGSSTARVCFRSRLLLDDDFATHTEEWASFVIAHASVTSRKEVARNGGKASRQPGRGK